MVVFTSCSSDKASTKNGFSLGFNGDSEGMVLIQGGSYQIGQTEDTVLFKFDNQPKVITVSSFYMDQYEVSNQEYRSFINYVKDSMIRNQYLVNEGREDELINWKERMSKEDKREARTSVLLESVNPAERSKVDSRKLVYTYYEIDFKKAAQRKNRVRYDSLGNWTYSDSVASRNRFIVENHIPIYPDTLVWVHDYTYSFNDPLTQLYFWHKAFSEYPVVGVTWEQARAYCDYRTKVQNKGEKGMSYVANYRLPTEAEWEYASRGGMNDQRYSWGDSYTRDDKGLLLANYKNMPGVYMEQRNKLMATTMRVGCFPSNGYGLYDMAGNVAEWTSTSYFAAGYEAMHDMNSEINFRVSSTDPITWKRRVVRGGSWKDVSIFLENASRSYEYQDTAKCYVGFRCVRSYLPD